MFSSLEKSELEVVIDAMDQRHVTKDQRVISQGDSGHELYVVEEGILGCWKTFVSETVCHLS